MLDKRNGKLYLKSLVFGWLLLVANGVYAEIILEYPTPTPDSSPSDLAFDAQGTLWFTELNTNRIGKLVPSEAKSLTTQGITEYELPHPNSKPHYLTIARDGKIWFSESGGNRIGCLDPKTGIIQEFDIPTAHSEPHQIKEGRDGNIWFLEFQTNKIGRLDPKSGQITEYHLGSGNPHALVLTETKACYTKGGMFWVNTFANKLGCMEFQTGNLEEFTIPPEKSVPHGLALSKGETLWLTKMFDDKLARMKINPGGHRAPRITEYFVGKRRRPHDLVVDENRGFIWFTAGRPDAIGRLDLSRAKPGTGRGLKYYKLPKPGSHPTRITMDKEGNIWFTEMGRYFRGKYNNKIGKLVP
ncbi:MAG: Lyase-like protein [Nitrospinaceae bacterium]|nr:Lyase-like protein [Nitrospinaceae bacterium]